MPDLDEAVRNQIRNIEASTGRSMDEWVALVGSSGRSKHGEIVAWLKSEHGLTHGNANRIALTALRGPAAPEGDALVDAIYGGPKAGLRPLHDRVVEVARGFGADVELAPKQAYVALRRSKQFGTVGPASGGRLEIGLNLKGIELAGRLETASGMCTHRVRLTDAAELRRRGGRLAARGVRARLTTAGVRWHGPQPRQRVRFPRAGSSAAEHGTFNPLVVGSNPTRLARDPRSGSAVGTLGRPPKGRLTATLTATARTRWTAWNREASGTGTAKPSYVPASATSGPMPPTDKMPADRPVPTRPGLRRWCRGPTRPRPWHRSGAAGSSVVGRACWRRLPRSDTAATPRA